MKLWPKHSPSIVTLGILLSFASSRLPSETPVVPWFVPPTPVEDPTFDQQTLKNLETFVVSVRWDNLDVAAALRDLAAQTKQVDPHHLGVRFTLNFPDDPQKPDDRGLKINRKVSLLILNIPVVDLIGYFCEQTNFTIRIRKNEVIFEQWRRGHEYADHPGSL